MKKILQRWQALFSFAPRPDPLELIVRAFALDPFKRKPPPSTGSKGE